MNDAIGLSGTNIFFIVFGVFVVIWLLLGIKNVMEGHVRLVERFGKYHKTLRPGINFVLPGIDIIKTDFDLLYSFPRYMRLKKKEYLPKCFGFGTVPPESGFSRMRFSLN